ncbi:MAG: hypothetical protein AAGF84_09050 [Planctomycetota bacterium]
MFRPTALCRISALFLGAVLLLPGTEPQSAFAQPPDEQRPAERPERPDRPQPQMRDGQRGEGPMRERFRERMQRFAEERGLDEASIAKHHEQVMAVLEDIDPDLADRFRNAENAPPGLQLMMLERRFPEALRLARLRQNDEEMYALRVRQLVIYRQMQGLARQIRIAEKQEAQGQDPTLDADDLRKDLEDLAEEHFEAEQAAEELEIERREQKLEEQRERLKQRDRHEREIIQKTIDQLLSGEARGPGRGGPGGPRGMDGDRPGRPERPQRSGDPRPQPPPDDQLDL